jgi:hypothetical protein
MATDNNLALFAGADSRSPSTHQWLKSSGGTRVVDAQARTITISRRSGRSQGVEIDLTNINSTAGRSYRFVLSGRVTSGAGPHQVTFVTVVSSGNSATLAQTNSATNATFSITHTLTHDQLAEYRSTGVTGLRLGGASREDLVVTGITITEIG